MGQYHGPDHSILWSEFQDSLSRPTELEGKTLIFGGFAWSRILFLCLALNLIPLAAPL